MTKIHNGSIINAALTEKVTCDAILLILILTRTGLHSCCHMVVVIWKLDEIFRNKKVQPIDTRSCTSKPRKGGIPGKRTVQHKAN